MILCLLLAFAGIARAESLDLVLPGVKKERLQFDISVRGEPLSAAWNAFLDRWFDYFDTNNGGALSEREASRIFPIPLPDDKSAAFAFAKADADGDGKVTRAELKAYYRAAGFTPILTIAEPASLRDAQIADAIFRHLGPDAGGKLTLERLKRAPELLRKLDENEDEVLTVNELLSAGSSRVAPPKRSDFAWRQSDTKSTDTTLKLALEFAPAHKLRVETVGKSLERISPATDADVARVRHSSALFALAFSTNRPAKSVTTSKHFILAQFDSVVGSAKAIEKKQLQDDASLQLLADVFPHADRDQDGKLTRDEVERFLGLIEEGVACPLFVRLTESGQNLFLHLDTNADGRLDLRELNGAARQVAALGGADGWTRTQVPYCVKITFQRGFAARSFGPVPIAGATTSAKAPMTVRSKDGPAWFQAMDKNGDGFVSPREFLGPIELFRRLDRDGDGLISVEEALLADRPSKKD